MQIAILVANDNMLTGEFADYFNLSKDVWTNLLVAFQNVEYILEICLFAIHVVSLSVDHGLIG